MQAHHQIAQNQAKLNKENSHRQLKSELQVCIQNSQKGTLKSGQFNLNL